MLKKSGSLIYFLGSVGLIVVAIAFTTFIQHSGTASVESEDIRARAGNPATLQMTARLVSIDAASNIVTVDSLRFKDGNTGDLGTWTVTPGPNVKMNSLTEGKNVLLAVQSSTFSIETHTLSALDIRPIQ